MTIRKKYLVIVVIVLAAVLLAILLDTMLANHLPAITSLKATPERVLPAGSCQIMCNATDADGDELSYNWSAIGGEINGEGATVIWKAPNSVGFYDITVNVTDGRGGKAIKTITIEVRTNKPPEINSLTADADWTLRSDSLNITCDATDPDGDELSYEWTATGGNISGTGPEVTWTAPNEVGIYHVTVVVKDSHGREDTRSVPLSVVTGTPPAIEDLVVTANHPYLRENGTGYDYKVWKKRAYNIECIVSDKSSTVSYNWSCDGGEISVVSQDGSMITWTAPNKTSVEITVMVIVSDVAGNRVSKSIAFYVPSCSCAF
ncbi:MAG: PKD domain-containing protein [Dehalococcoidia bacterium]|nr:PKD domain-containing protein [Dehalococcoidia bacterium]RLC64146.1 MAG: hypothetical protein DRI01_03975 [Chloroflexota bacterium]